MRTTLNVFLLVLGLFGIGGLPQALAQSVTSTFMLVPGIKGSSTEALHRDWIDVVSLTQTLDQSKRHPQCTLEVVKGLDVSGPLLWGAAVTGRVFGEIQIDVTMNQLNASQLLYQIKLQNARVRGISTIGNGGYVERVTLDAASVQLLFSPPGANGGATPPVTSSFAC